MDGAPDTDHRKRFCRNDLRKFALVAAITLLGSTAAPADAQPSPRAASPLAGEPGFGAPVGFGGPKPSAGRVSWQVLQNPQGPHTVIVFDAGRGVLAVYQVDPASGAINLKSVRRVEYDLKLDEFETNDPKPSDLRDAQR